MSKAILLSLLDTYYFVPDNGPMFVGNNSACALVIAKIYVHIDKIMGLACQRTASIKYKFSD